MLYLQLKREVDKLKEDKKILKDNNSQLELDHSKKEGNSLVDCRSGGTYFLTLDMENLQVNR